MMDKSLGIWLMIIFGLSGAAVILLAWLVPTSSSARVTATIAGSVGVIIAAARGFTLRQTNDRQNKPEIPVKVDLTNHS